MPPPNPAKPLSIHLSPNIPAGGTTEPVGACARGETKSLRASALNSAAVPTRATPGQKAPPFPLRGKGMGMGAPGANAYQIVNAHTQPVDSKGSKNLSTVDSPFTRRSRPGSPPYTPPGPAASQNGWPRAGSPASPPGSGPQSSRYGRARSPRHDPPPPPPQAP